MRRCGFLFFLFLLTAEAYRLIAEIPSQEENYGWHKKETGMESLPQNMTYPSLNEDSTFSVSDPIKGAHVTYTIKVIA